MAKPLQSGHHDEVNYNRPDQMWVCGHLCEGRSCALGPDDKGSCQGGAECLPLRHGDRWGCARPGHRGGPCENGPLADGACCRSLVMCSPQRSQRSRRMRTSMAVVLLTIGLLLVVFAGRRSDRERVISAGPLSTAHASEGMRCEDCHSAAETDFFLAGIEGGADSRIAHIGAMSVNCLKCHANMAGENGEAAGYSHGLLPSTLASLQVDSSDGEGVGSKDEDQADKLLRWVSRGAVPERGQAGEMSCQTCHGEHHGKRVSLSELSDQQCQICHQRQFESFSEGHPSFAETGYPYKRRTQLFFDHTSHYGKHFSGEKSEHAPNRSVASQGDPLVGGDLATPLESASCRACHSSDPRGERMLVNGYQASCSACHDDAVSGGNHVPLLTLPSLPDSGDTAAADGRWPSIDDGAFPLTPLMMALLPPDAHAAASKLELEQFDGLGTGNRYLSASAEGSADGIIAQSLQQLWSDVWKNGPTALNERLAANGWPVDGPDGEGSESPADEALFAGLSLDSLRAFLFPGYAMSLFELSFPALDQATLDEFLASKGRSSGSWPKRAIGEISPSIRLLLEQNPLAQKALLVLDAGAASLSDLSVASTQQLQAAEDLAWQIKWLFSQFSNHREADLVRRLQPLQGGVLNRLSDAELLSKTFTNARRDEVMSAGFEKEFAAYLRGDFPDPIARPPSAGGGVVPKADSGGDDDFGGGEKKAADDDFGGDEKKAADDDFGGGEKKAADDDFGGDEKKAADDNFGGGEKKAADDDFGGGETEAADDNFGGGESSTQSPAKAPSQPLALPSEPSSPGEWQREGGWFFDSEGRHALSYVSSGHADPVLKRWLDVLAAASSVEDSRVRQDSQLLLETAFGFRDGVKTSSSGKCLKCHTVDITPRSDLPPLFRINWSGSKARFGEKVQLTRFDHRKHTFAIGCIECHQLSPNAKDSGNISQTGAVEVQYVDFFPTQNVLHANEGLKAHNPSHYHSNFQPMNHQTSCAVCHQPQLAGNSCLQCHSYHHLDHSDR